MLYGTEVSFVCCQRAAMIWDRVSEPWVWIAPLLLLIGFASQRSSVCMVRGMDELVRSRRVHRLAGFLLAAATAMLLMAFCVGLGRDPFRLIGGTSVSWLAVLGGVIFAVGAQMNGMCALGTLASLTIGNISRIATMVGMVGAALLCQPLIVVTKTILHGSRPVMSPLAGHGWISAGVAVTAMAATLVYLWKELGWRRVRGGWSPMVAMIVIGAASGLLYALDQQWAYTSRIAALAHGRPVQHPVELLTPLLLLVGMVAGGRSAGRFRWQWGSLRQWLRAGAGGAIMGVGAVLVPGGNDAMLFTGLTLLLPNLLIAYAAFMATLFIGLTVAHRRTNQPSLSALPERYGGAPGAGDNTKAL